MTQKSIVFTEKNKAELLCEPMPEPKPGEVLVKLVRSTISSGTERACLTGDPNVSIARPASTVARFPRRVGYSSSGIVAAVGEGVTSLKVGDRVGTWGTKHSLYNCISERNAVKLDDSIGFDEAALWYIASFSMQAVRKTNIEVGESAIVMGVGVLGMMAIKLLRVCGAVPLIAVDPVPEKRELALKLGADFAFDPFEEGFALKVREVTGGGANAAIEVTGNGKALAGVLDCMARFGRVALLGCTRSSDFTIDYYHKVHGPGIQLIGAHNTVRPTSDSYHGMWTNRDDILALNKLVNLGRLELASVVDEVHSPEEAPEVFTRLANNPAFPVVQFDWTLLD